jgi:transcription-repair coupling factor (superfamily II helicase)
LHVDGLIGSAISIVIHSLLKAEHPFDCFKQQRRSRYYLNDLEQLIGEQDVLFYPGSFRRPYQIERLTMLMFCFVPKY